MPTRTELERGVGEVLIDEATLQARIAELGEEISAFYDHRDPPLLGLCTEAFRGGAQGRPGLRAVAQVSRVRAAPWYGSAWPVTAGRRSLSSS